MKRYVGSMLSFLLIPAVVFTGAVILLREPFLRGIGESLHPLIYVIITTIENIILGLLFVAALGFDGLALAYSLAGHRRIGLWSVEKSRIAA